MSVPPFTTDSRPPLRKDARAYRRQALTALPRGCCADAFGCCVGLCGKRKEIGVEGKGILQREAVRSLALLLPGSPPDCMLREKNAFRAYQIVTPRAPRWNAVFLRRSVLFQRNHSKSDRNTSRTVTETPLIVKRKKGPSRLPRAILDTSRTALVPWGGERKAPWAK